MSTLTEDTSYTLTLDAAQVDVILRGLFCLVKDVPSLLDSTGPGSRAEQQLLDVNELATRLIEALVELPGVLHS